MLHELERVGQSAATAELEKNYASKNANQVGNFMFGSLESRGTKAWARVKQRIKNEAELRVLMVAKGQGALNSVDGISSCNVTAAVLGDILCGGKVEAVHMAVTARGVMDDKNGFPRAQGGRDAVSLTQDERARKVNELLTGGNMVVISTGSPDHHFVVFPINKTEVVILQGFQGVYNLVQWMENASEEGKFNKEKLVQALQDLVSNNEKIAKPAAVALFSYDTNAQAVSKFYNGTTVIVTIAYRALS